jgi:hypothetical protein
MSEHRLQEFGTFTTRTVARRRRVHAARRCVAGVRARIAELQTTTTTQIQADTDAGRDGDRTT